MDNSQKQEKYARYFLKGGSVLELGSGGGDFLRICGNLGLKATGVDLNPTSTSSVKVVKKDIIKYLKSEKKTRYNGIYARHIIEHFPEAGLKILFKNCYRLMKKNGKLVAVFPNINNIGVATTEFWKDKTHVKPYSPEETAGMMNAAGFRVIERGPDRESWDNSAVKNLLRKLRSAISGVKNEPPDYYIVAEK